MEAAAWQTSVDQASLGRRSMSKSSSDHRRILLHRCSFSLLIAFVCEDEFNKSQTKDSTSWGKPIWGLALGGLGGTVLCHLPFW